MFIIMILKSYFISQLPRKKNGEREREQVPEFLYFRQLNTFDYARIHN